MSLVCPSCEALPDAAAKAAGSCGSCGAKLVRVADRDPLIGTTLDGRFAIREQLGSGAMGVVYRATQLSIGRDVAVKVMTGMDVTAVKRFFREAQIASALSHPNTVQIIEFGQGPDGQVYLAMELVRGRTLLDETAEHGALSSRRICRIGTQLCDALEAAHRLTIVHRDLKPENVMIAPDGNDHIKILDFGIARVLGDASSRVTGVGLTAGTPNYMAPEVLGKGAEPEAAQDMYALGVLLAELATGQPMWSAPTLEMLYLEKTQNTALDKVPARLRPIVTRLLDPEPALRPSATETRKLLRELDRTATDPVGIAATMAPMRPLVSTPTAPLPAPLDLPLELDIVDLSVHTGAPPLAPVAPPKPVTVPVIEPLSPDTINVAPRDAPLELEGSWHKERAARVASKKAVSTVAARVIAEGQKERAHNNGTWIAMLLVVVALGGGAYYWMTRDAGKPAEVADPTPVTPVAPAQPERPRTRPAPPKEMVTPPENTVPDRGVSIRIVGNPGTPVTIDGAAAGKTPLSLKRSISKRAFVIGANGSTWKIVPDKSQTIDITQP